MKLRTLKKKKKKKLKRFNFKKIKLNNFDKFQSNVKSAFVFFIISINLVICLLFNKKNKGPTSEADLAPN